MRILATDTIVLSCSLFAASCIQSPDRPPTSTGAESPLLDASTELTDEAGESTGEAVDPFTKADCYAAWHHNLEMCNTKVPVPARPHCWYVASLILGVCLAGAEG